MSSVFYPNTPLQPCSPSINTPYRCLPIAPPFGRILPKIARSPRVPLSQQHCATDTNHTQIRKISTERERGHGLYTAHTHIYIYRLAIRADLKSIIGREFYRVVWTRRHTHGFLALLCLCDSCSAVLRRPGVLAALHERAEEERCWTGWRARLAEEEEAQASSGIHGLAVRRRDAPALLPGPQRLLRLQAEEVTRQFLRLII